MPSSWALTSLSAGQTLALLTSSILLYLTLSSLIKRWHHLRGIPGPSLARLSYLWILRFIYLGDTLTRLDELSKQYGPITRVGPNEVIVSDFDELIRINGVRSAYPKSGWYMSMRFDPGEGLSMLNLMDTAAHDRRKAKLMRGFEGKGDVDLEMIVDSQLKIMIDLLREKHARTGKPVDWAATARYFSMDVASLAVVGRAFGHLPTESDIFKFFEIGDVLVPFMNTVSMLAPFRRILSSTWFLKRAGPSSTDEFGVGKIMGFVENEINERFKNPDLKRGDMLDEWIKAGLTPRESAVDAGLAIIAAGDTVASPIRSTLLYLASTPYAYNKLKAEIKTASSSGLISNPVTAQQALHLPYLQAVLHEVFRILPISLTGFAKQVPVGGDTICGHYLPAGVEIFPNNRAVMLNKAVFGEDVQVFRPERWLDASPEKHAYMVKHVDLQFGFGRWQCAGKILAWMELNKCIVEMMRNFDVQIVDPSKPWSLSSYNSVVISGFHVRITEA
ncbi:cytochrome P450 [Apodospora peruviana]|uniref:Cytochrome P450 n=1 Tax=Apodospora peruviana TaxID=516989 RepID=A0AAE0HZJ2_9PEZI|nr:cytochrome P450 [Apodospora peruviana]